MDLDAEADRDLFEACHRGDTAAIAVAIAVALAAGARVGALDGRGMSPLHFAVAHWRQRAVAALLAAGADPRLQAAYGNSAIATLPYPREGLSFLAANGARGDLTGVPLGQSLDGLPAHSLRHLRVRVNEVQFLLEAGADPNEPHANGCARAVPRSDGRTGLDRAEGWLGARARELPPGGGPVARGAGRVTDRPGRQGGVGDHSARMA